MERWITMGINKRAFGADGEKYAVEYLKKRNFRILETNSRFGRLGEIDIIARDGEYLCFIEVKTRSSTLFGLPREAVDVRKQANIIKMASMYIKRNKITYYNARFDVVEVIAIKTSDDKTRFTAINLIKNAFGT